jgi:hypothetical protein
VAKLQVLVLDDTPNTGSSSGIPRSPAQSDRIDRARRRLPIVPTTSLPATALKAVK